jgi:hypothetical protein
LTFTGTGLKNLALVYVHEEEEGGGGGGGGRK